MKSRERNRLAFHIRWPEMAGATNSFRGCAVAVTSSATFNVAFNTSSPASNRDLHPKIRIFCVDSTSSSHAIKQTFVVVGASY